MKAIIPEELNWEPDGSCFRCLLTSQKLGDSEVRVEMFEVPAGATVAPHYHKEQRLALCVVRSAGAQLFLGERLFRPQAGQTFVCDPQDVSACVNDTPHALRVLITRIGFKDDKVAVDKKFEELMAPAAPMAS